MPAYRSRRLVVVLVAVLAVAASCSSSDDDESSAPTSIEERLEELSGAGVFVGGVAMTTNLVAVHYDRSNKDAVGMKIFVTDGTPNGNAEWFEGNATGETFKFTSKSGNATIDGTIEPFETDGSITLADGTPRNFFTRPAGDGAGTFDITVGADGTWNGKSLDGATLTAKQTGPYVEGSVVTTNGNKYDFRHNDLTRRLGYATPGGAPDTYTAVVTRQATEIQGRGGDVKGGQPDGNVVSLDLSQEATPTPGVYHGRVAGVTDRLNFETAANPDGTTLLRAYVSDSEPEPAGDLQWFASPVTPPNFSITSKMEEPATMTGTISDEGIGGEITLPGAEPRKFYAVPSGQGAGIFEVTVTEDRQHTGTSAQGAKLDLKYQEGTVMGTLTAPDGQSFPMLGADLAHAFRYSDEYSKPGQYTAFVAPRGRYVYGRSNDSSTRNVRGGSSGVNIIGLDKKC